MSKDKDEKVLRQLAVCRAASRPSAMKVYAVDLGRSVSNAVASTLVGNSVLSTALATELSQASTIAASAQMQSLGLLALRVPLRAATALFGSGPRVTKFAGLVSDYCARNATAVNEITKMGFVAQVGVVGIQANLVGAIATAAVKESLAVAYYVHGGSTAEVLKEQTLTIGISTAASVGGGAAGAALGCLAFPGIGTALGSLLGSFAGAYIPFYIRGDGFSQQANEDPSNPSRKVKAVSALDLTDWLEVVDCTTESYFGVKDLGGDSMSALRSSPMPDDTTGGFNGHGASSVFYTPHQALPTPKDDEVIIYFLPEDANESSHAKP